MSWINQGVSASPQLSGPFPSVKAYRASQGSAWLETFVSACNGVVGDYLAQRGNELTITMTLLDGEAALSSPPANRARKVVVLVHGLAYNERIWAFPDQPDLTYGALLQQDLGYAPWYVRYNSGLHIHENGRQLAQLLEQVSARQAPTGGAEPDRLEEIVLLGHSMGGLVLRSACHYGQQQRHRWVDLVSKVFYLATPHQGAPLERWGRRVSALLADWPQGRLEWLARLVDLRSNGIKDLGDGRFTDHPAGPPAQAAGSSADSLESAGPALPLLPTARHYAFAGSLTENPDHPLGRLVGDVLVTLPSSTGRAQGLTIPAEQTKVFAGLHHNQLAHHRAVYECIKSFIEEG